MKRMLADLTEGFVGAFVLAGAIVMAIVNVAKAFAGSDQAPKHPHFRDSVHPS